MTDAPTTTINMLTTKKVHISRGSVGNLLVTINSIHVDPKGLISEITTEIYCMGSILRSMGLGDEVEFSIEPSLLTEYLDGQ